MITRSREYLRADGLPTAEMLVSVLRDHQADRPRLERLRAAYENRGPILKRERRRELPNNRLAHPFARYITVIATGYLIGRPVVYGVPGDDSPALRAIQDAFRRGSESAENTQIARDQSIYGKGVEYVHADRDAVPHTTAVSPLSAFVVYDDTCDMEPLFGVYYLPRRRADGAPDGWRIWVMSGSVIAEYAAAALTDPPRMQSVTRHYFGGVPIVEYWNNELESGDFECVLTLIDNYDLLQSDRVNDKEQFVDRLLVLTGAVLEEDERGRTPMQQLREDHALQLPDTQSKAEYLASEMKESDVEVLRRALAGDIHKLSLVPDLSDEKFSANASGVAMKYKLLGFEQLIRVKEQWFTEGLRQRLRLFSNFLTLRGLPALDVADVRITFSRALPVNAAENADIAQTAAGAGAASLETLVRLLHQGENWSDTDVAREAERIRAERAGTDAEGRDG